MKIIILIILTAFTSIITEAQNLHWSKSMGGLNNEFGATITTDNQGNVLIAGRFKDTVDFDPGPNTFNLDPTSIGWNDFFIQKLDPSGNFIWAKSIGGLSEDIVTNITVDAFGDILVTGYYRDTVDFDPGIGVYNLISNGSGSQDIFILKLDASGNFIWVKSIGGTSIDQGNSIITDASGNIIVTGVFSNTVDFDPGINVYNLISNGSKDIFILKIDISGNFIWAKSINGSNIDDIGYSITIDISNNILLTGNFHSTVDFDPGIGVYNLSTNGIADIFVLKLDSSGNFLWAKSLGGVNEDTGNSITTDESDNVIITGFFKFTVDFDPGPGLHNITTNGGTDIFVLKLDDLGNFLWVKTIGGTSLDRGESIKTNTSGDIILTGWFYDTVDFDPGINNSFKTSNGSADIFVLVLDSLGEFYSVKTIGGSGWDAGRAITYNNSGNLILTGAFQDTVDFDPGINTNILFSKGGQDIFVTNFCFNKTQDTVLNICSGDSIMIYGVYQTLTGVYYDSLQTVNGCDSILSTTLTVNPIFSSNQNSSICQGDSILLGGIYQTTNGVYYDSLQTINGCDSLITSILTVFIPSAGTDSRAVCNSLTWINGITYTSNNNTATFNITGGNANGCDSLVALDLTIINSSTGIDTRTECDSITWIDGITYTSNNNIATYNIVGGSVNSCDSLVTIDLTIANLDANYTFSDNGNGNYSFTNTSIGNFNQSHWAFGDGSIDSTTNTNHTFTTNGIFEVVLTVADSAAGSTCFDYFTTTINVTGVPSPLPCHAGFVMYPDTGINNVTVVNSSTGTNLTYLWDFGDATGTSALQNPTHTYAFPGTYQLCLTVDDGAGCVDMYCDFIGENGVVFNKAGGFTINVISPNTTGIDNNIDLNSEVNIYPNPTSNQLTIDTEHNISEVNIIDITGKIIITNKLNTNTINVADLSNGIYFIQLITEERTITKKFVKQ